MGADCKIEVFQSITSQVITSGKRRFAQFLELFWSQNRAGGRRPPTVLLSQRGRRKTASGQDTLA